LSATTSPPLDREAASLPEDHLALRLWLRMLTCTLLIEKQVNGRLKTDFAQSLPRFDLLSQLHRHPAGLRMTELSRRMMVTGGSVTGLTDGLQAEGLVERHEDPADRRSKWVRLTALGRKRFVAMAAEHAQWIAQMMGGLSAAEQRELYRMLARLKTSIGEAGDAGEVRDAGAEKT
jgi:DNA-binding MarR family transcriptional regulator